MKYLKFTFDFFLLLLFVGCSKASKNIIVCGKVISPTDFTMRIYEPINGFYNTYQFDTVKINSYLVGIDSFYFNRKAIDKPSFFYIDFFIKGQFSSRAVFQLTPGDSTYVNVDLTKQDLTWVKFSGDNSAGNNLFNEMNQNPAEKFSPVKELAKIFDNYDAHYFIGQLKNITDSTILPYKKLLQSKKISESYFTSIEKTFKMIFNNWIIAKLIYKDLIPNNTIISKRNLVVEGLFSQLPINDPEIKSLFLSQLYFQNYFRFQTMKENKIDWAGEMNKKNIVVPFKDSTIEVDKLLAHIPLIKDKQYQEIIWANSLASIFLYAKGHFNDSVITQFSIIYPKSLYLPYLKSLYEREVSNKINGEPELFFPSKIIDTSNHFTTLKQLTDAIGTGKPAFIDVWATWCGPCISEFSFNRPIDSFLLKNNINRIYISIDQKGYHEAWIKSIEKYKLGGSHIFGNPALLADIKRRLGIANEGGFSIPIYFIINSKGEVITPNAARPSDGDLLIKQLEEVQ